MSALHINNKISQLLSINAWMSYFRFASGIQCGWHLDDRTAAPSGFRAAMWCHLAIRQFLIAAISLVIDRRELKIAQTDQKTNLFQLLNF